MAGGGGGGGGGQQPQGDNSYGPLWITVGLFALFWAIWHFAQAYIVAFVLNFKLLEINFVNLFTSQLVPLEGAIRAIPPSDYTGVNFQTLMNISEKVGEYLRYPIAVILGVLAAIIYFHSPVLRFKKTYNMQRLVDEEGREWPQITPVAKLDLIKTPVNEGPWAMALTPMEFAKKYRLLVEERVLPGENELLSKMSTSVSLLRGEAHKAFVLQLGPYWAGEEALPIHAKAIYAILVARIDGNRAGSMKLIFQISASASGGKLDFSGIDDMIKKHKNNKHVVKVTKRHAFVYTVMASLLDLARHEGVLAVSDFLWLKPVDRALWFMLNGVGRKTPVAEVAGPFAHWIAEQNFGQRINVPMVDEAVLGLEAAIKEVVYKPDGEE